MVFTAIYAWWLRWTFLKKLHHKINSFCAKVKKPTLLCWRIPFLRLQSTFTAPKLEERRTFFLCNNRNELGPTHPLFPSCPLRPLSKGRGFVLQGQMNPREERGEKGADLQFRSLPSFFKGDLSLCIPFSLWKLIAQCPVFIKIDLKHHFPEH